MGRKRIPLAERFWSKVAPPNERGCRLWQAIVSGRSWKSVN